MRGAGAGLGANGVRGVAGVAAGVCGVAGVRGANGVRGAAGVADGATGATGDDARRLMAVLEAQRWRLAMFASCGWFWEDPARTETRQVLRAAARAAFTRAFDLYTSLGAARDVGRLQAQFRAEGIRRGPRVKHRKAQRGWDSLTPTEIKVVGLVAEGLSNVEIAERLTLRVKTVESQLRRLFDRYDVSSRTALARLAVRQGWIDEA